MSDASDNPAPTATALDPTATLVAAFLRRYPDPLALLRRVFPGCVRQAAVLGLTVDDIRSACFEGVVRAAGRYDPAKGDFATFAPWVMRQVVDEDVYRPQRDIDRRGGESGGRVVSLADEAAAGVRDHRESDTAAVERDELAAAAVAAVDGMSDADRELIRTVFGLGGVEVKSVRRLAAERGIPPTTMRQRVAQVVGRLRAKVMASAPC